MRESTKPRLVGHEVVICTRNRPNELASALRAIARSTHTLDVLVVDSTDGPDARLAVEAASTRELGTWRVRYLHTTPGLTHQRNCGLDASTARIVHFIDDDADVHPSYFANIASVFDSYGNEVVGVGGLQSGVPVRRPRRWRLLMQVEALPGQLSRSAVNNMWTAPAAHPVEVDWLSGCAMSFRREPASMVRFSDLLTGYSLGEDVDFCIRISEFGKLLINPLAVVDHNFSPIDRYDISRNVRETILHRHRIVSAYPNRFSLRSFWLSVATDAASYCVRAALGRKVARLALSGLAAAVLELLKAHERGAKE